MSVALKKLRSSPTDVVVVVGTEENAKQYDCYGVVLAAASEVIDTMLASGMEESETRIVKLPDIEPEQFELFYSMLYGTSSQGTSKLSTENVAKVVPLFNYFNMEKWLVKCDPLMAQIEPPVITDSGNEEVKLASFNNLLDHLSVCAVNGLQESSRLAMETVEQLVCDREIKVDNSIMERMIQIARHSEGMWKFLNENCAEKCEGSFNFGRDNFLLNLSEEALLPSVLLGGWRINLWSQYARHIEKEKKEANEKMERLKQQLKELPHQCRLARVGADATPDEIIKDILKEKGVLDTLGLNPSDVI